MVLPGSFFVEIVWVVVLTTSERWEVYREAVGDPSTNVLLKSSCSGFFSLLQSPTSPCPGGVTAASGAVFGTVRLLWAVQTAAQGLGGREERKAATGHSVAEETVIGGYWLFFPSPLIWCCNCVHAGCLACSWVGETHLGLFGNIYLNWFILAELC